MKKKKGFSLVEILIAIAILLIMMVIAVSTFNAVGINNKGRDAQRKKDLGRIKIAFEEYFSDKGFFPSDIGTWNTTSNCGTDIFKPYLASWPCDPKGVPYYIIVGESSFRVITNLENKTDKDIPNKWYERTNYSLAGLGVNDINYGVSSANILWYDLALVSPSCDTNMCLSNKIGGCNSVGNGCFGSNCFYYDWSNPGNCTSKCKTFLCGAGGPN